MKKAVLLLIGFLVVPLFAQASDYLYRGRVEFIKIEGAGKKILKKQTLTHPHHFDDNQMRGILSAIKFSKKAIIMKSVDRERLFNDKAVEFLLPYFIRAFDQMNEKELLAFAYIDQNPKFLIRNDRLTTAKMFVEGGKLHIRFSKLYAKLLGDYQRKGSEHLINDARGINVSLEYGPGVEPSAEGEEEITLNLAYDFTKDPPALIAGTDKDKKNKKGKGAEKKKPESQPTTPAPKAEAGKTPRERLKELDHLRNEELITDKEYREKRREVLKDL
ncbi:MAG: hypothetical protein HYS22_05090 [Deltaproteobacteria bacterium]|nr:hypothetical protein [Deltaproteobacteria bacterium]